MKNPWASKIFRRRILIFLNWFFVLIFVLLALFAAFWPDVSQSSLGYENIGFWAFWAFLLLCFYGIQFELLQINSSLEKLDALLNKILSSREEQKNKDEGGKREEGKGKREGGREDG